MERIDILLSTYNGEAYIDELVESVMNQSYDNINLMIRDDGSKDGTVDRINIWKERYPNKVTIIQDDKGNVGVTRSMFFLLKYSESPYVIFCDQDDVWFENKVHMLMRGMRYKEKRYPDIPIIVHCESYVVNSNLKMVCDDERKSRHSYLMGRSKRQVHYGSLLISNVVQGASMLFNEELKKMILPLVDEYRTKELMYDSIIASVCSITGKIFYMDKPLMYYRQHSRNVLGVVKTSLLKLNQYDERLRGEVQVANYLLVNKRKCELLKKYYSSYMTVNQMEVLEHWLKRPNDWLEFFKLGLHKCFSLKQIVIMVLYGVR